MPRLSVVIPHFGDSRPTTHLVQQLLAQDGVDEVIVVDDASPSPFPAMAGVRLKRRPTNGGFGAAVNSGVAEASGDLALVLNSDVTVGPRFVTDLLEAAEPWLPAVVSPRVVSRAGTNEWVGRHFPTVAHQVVEWLHPLVRLRPRLHEAVGHDTSALGRTAVVDWVIGAALLLPVEPFRAVGGFDERFHMNAEEVDLQRRLRSSGIRSVVVEEPHIVHEGGGSTPSPDRRRWLVESRLAYAHKWGGPIAERRLRAALITASAANLFWNIARAMAGRDSQPLSTFRSELALLRTRRGLG
ncbi:glycosyltransferase family 2 protein [Nocardioides ganghwensis]|jgi:N-acetylglucosaminyl-diphospho-decaprenol L-rhamnosyltransferase|uniref:Glycosyltransferase family 2 protein n=1 Tax=Nocardioides ganghwensis TaxID=252230 RepID=A0A4Q2SAC0_9ACTN|nr:glycosyltransferase family 2 protein [Nocardioides ganghwensis]MBD3947236.1 glycosyltransferase family 2 protein [Nocardioides ganghwensis]RYC00738.1 glycosyltransferase family 2 protein [Nocardioides ganghwensis]